MGIPKTEFEDMIESMETAKLEEYQEQLRREIHRMEEKRLALGQRSDYVLTKKYYHLNLVNIELHERGL